MAIKGWKKVNGTNKWKSKKGRWISVYHIISVEQKKWQVHLGTENSMKFRRLLTDGKSETKALKFAKRYMRKHPKG